MAFLATDRNWLFTPSTMKKVQQCRRLIQMEFGIKLHLTEETLVEQIEGFAGKSRSDTLGKTWRQLKEEVPELAETLAISTPDTTKRTYRGQPLADAAPETAHRSADHPSMEQPRKTRVIYRGRVVS